MTFYLRGIAVSFSVFLALYSALSVAVCCMWRRIWRFGQRGSAERCADLLFVLRIAPFVVAAGLTPFSHADYEPGRRFYFLDPDGIEYEVVSYMKVA